VSDKERDEFETLLRWADKYIRYPQSSTADAVARWRNKTVLWLRKNLPDSGLYEEFLTVPPSTEYRYYDAGKGLTPRGVANVQRGLKVLRRARDLLPFLQEGSASKTPRAENANKVFIVHGHNQIPKVAAARLVERLGLKAVILHEQPSRGRTIIEKFFQHADVAFAIVILSGDDSGGLADTPSHEYKLRARQNVIFELGFFLGRLDRERVAAIYEPGVEIPSDYSGVIFIPYDERGAWEISLAKEMKAVGLKIDLNKILDTYRACYRVASCQSI
jgi:predicted nucleotide-binding protein